RQRRGFGLAKTSLSGTIPTVRYRGFLPFGRQFWVGGNCDFGGGNSGGGFRVVGQEPGERGRPAHREGGGPAVRGAGLRRDGGAGDRRGGRGDEADPVLPLREQGGPGAGARDRTPDGAGRAAPVDPGRGRGPGRGARADVRSELRLLPR